MMTKEFIRLGRAEVLAFEETMRVQKHLDRYFTIRQFCYGRVLDIACGTGYGSYIIGTNPKVLGVLGVDKNEESIAFARDLLTNAKLAIANTIHANHSWRNNIFSYVGILNLLSQR